MKHPMPLVTIKQWEEALTGSAGLPVLVFKHSSLCSVSSGAYDELAAWLEDAVTLSLSCFVVDVVEYSAVSQAIAASVGIRHESPQTLFIENGIVTWHASHWSITYSALEDHLGNHCEK
ncbi:bacillithiol system redox-active protein YtxJ [Paenibacillus nasutitermitis]|uniref:Bacillithiol system redox-active protein YtxJ n=1 Tax=Paenibacillus nasutitermitis TaxID=1652958 RepID=A0A916YX31_9BACL|nr:bacillithiol system redox-active protein YtxJ [Paenibacillus nasutitermitis]GGD65324.1 hypothetical protein GCM10010911_23890 [Paenibacillus nasutitermitis]